VSPITSPLSPAGVAPVAAPGQGPLDAPARKFAALMDAVEAGRPSSLAQTVLPQDEGPGSLDKSLASTGEGPADGEAEGTPPSPLPVQPAAFDTSLMFHLRA
jgi:hypothetical protein